MELNGRRMNSTRAHSTDQVKGTDVGVDDGKGRSGDSAVVEGKHRIDSFGSDGGPARLHENRDWLMQNGQPLAHHPSGNIGEWAEFAGVENRWTGNAHTADQAC